MYLLKFVSLFLRLKVKKKYIMKDIEEWMIKDLMLDFN